MQRCNVRLSNYVSNTDTKSYKDVVHQITSGNTDPEKLITYIHGRILNKWGKDIVKKALTGVFTETDIDILKGYREELEEISKIIEITNRNKTFELNFIEGKIKNNECILVKGGVGKVNAARATQILIDNYKPDYIIDTGVAGGLNPMLEIGDIVIGEKLVQHDFDITAFGHTKGYITGVGDKIYADEFLLKNHN